MPPSPEPEDFVEAVEARAEVQSELDAARATARRLARQLEEANL